jgi:hypothetical protein
VEEPQFYLYVHRVLELLDTLLHRTEIGSEVALGFLFDEGEGDSEQVEKVVNSMEYRV